MAVLKSPRNSRHKRRLSASFALQFRNARSRLLTKHQLRVEHKLHLFYVNRAYYLASPKAVIPKALIGVPCEKPQKPIRPDLVVRYGKHSFNTTDTHPIPFRRHLLQTTHKERLFILMNLHSLASLD